MTWSRWLLVVVGVFLSTNTYAIIVAIECPNANSVKQTYIQTLQSTNCNGDYRITNSQGVPLDSIFVGQFRKSFEDCSAQIRAAQKAVFTGDGQHCQKQLSPIFVSTCGYSVSGMSFYYLALQPMGIKYQRMFSCTWGSQVRDAII